MCFSVHYGLNFVVVFHGGFFFFKGGIGGRLVICVLQILSFTPIVFVDRVLHLV